jgi:6-phosphogluconolactonase
VPILAFSGSLTRPAPNYGAANGRGITTFTFDPEAGLLTPVAELGGIDDTSWLTLDAPRRRLYAICEVPGADQSYVAAFSIDFVNHRLIELNRRPTGGQTACHASLTPDGRFLVVANYNAVVPEGLPDGAGVVFPIGADGRLDPPVAHFRHDGSGPNPERQERSHAHCAMPSPDGHFVYVADLGMDRIFAYALSPEGKLTHRPESDFSAPAGIGPRHLVFSPDGRRLFMVSELIATVISLAVDPETGALTELDSYTIPPTGTAIQQSAGIVITADGRHVFASLRVCDEIVGLSVDPATGRLTETGRWPSGGATPRDLTFSPDGRHLIVSNQDSDRISVFGVNGGSLTGPLHQIGNGTPMETRLGVF